MLLVSRRWYVVLASHEVPPGQSVGVRRLGRALVFWRDDNGQVAAALDECPHRWAKLSGGPVIEGHLACPFHGFRFDGSGACTAIPAHPERRLGGAMSLDALHVHEHHGFIWLWTGEDAPDGSPPAFFDFSGFNWAGSGFTEQVRCHYTRAIENQLDFAHLPFVHANTIGRLSDPVVDVKADVRGDLISARLDGSPGPTLEFQGPNIWRLRTGPVWQFLAMVPIDADNTLYYSRAYQPFVQVPGLDWCVGVVQAWLNRRVLREDTPLVEGQPAGAVRLGSGEVLVPSDAPIIAYRRWRRALGSMSLPESRATRSSAD